MFTAEYVGINSFLIGSASLLLEHGVNRKTRGLECCELPAPFMFKISNPSSRWITIPERKWNVTLAYAESLWLASGRNDLDMIGSYLSRMKDYSDDGHFLRGGYGPRMRKYNGNRIDYAIREYLEPNNSSGKFADTDQFSYVIANFQRDINTRQAIISIGDPPKDCFDENGCLKSTKDFPCTRLLHFMKHPIENKLNLTVYMRSNDILWGASAVNIFNFTFMQEYFARILNLEVGDYYHIANNFHFYEDKRIHIESIAKVKTCTDESFKYNYSFSTLKDFDKLLLKLNQEEFKLRNNSIPEVMDFEDDFFNDWYKIIYRYHTKTKVDFANPILNSLFDPKN